MTESFSLTQVTCNEPPDETVCSDFDKDNRRLYALEDNYSTG